MIKYLREIKSLRKNKNFYISTAESCTGGMVSNSLTSIDGSSSFYNGSIICYSNDFKLDNLNVKKTIISRYGAVSHQTALSMVKGLSKKSSSNILISITGVAGPNGGTKKTPVGCVFFGIGNKKNNQYKFKTIKKLFKDKTRNMIRKKTTEFALKLIINEIKLI